MNKKHCDTCYIKTSNPITTYNRVLCLGCLSKESSNYYNPGPEGDCEAEEINYDARSESEYIELTDL
jgi:hypothetical protein